MKISIGISFFNAEKYLKQSIQSVLNQTYKDFELLLINDGSTDRSLQIAQSFKDARIKTFSDGLKKGLAYRLNELVQKSSGDFFFRMDADDIMVPEKIELQLDYIKKHPDIDVLGCNAYAIDTDNNIIGNLQYKQHPSSIADVYKHTCFIHPTIMARRQWFIDNPYNPESIRMEDYNLWLRTIEQYRFENMDSKLFFYRSAGLPYLSKYIKSMKGELNELKSIKSKIPSYYCIVAKIYIKCIVYSLFSAINMTDYLIKKRFSDLSMVEKQTALKLLKQAIKE